MRRLFTLVLGSIGAVAFGQQVPATITIAAVNPAVAKKMQQSKRFTHFITNSSRKIYEESVMDDPFSFEAIPVMEMNRLAGYTNEPEKEIYKNLHEVRKRRHESEQKMREKKFHEQVTKATVVILYM